MYMRSQNRSAKLTHKLRKDAGHFLRKLREERGLSQRELANKVGEEHYFRISELEHGRGRVASDRYLAWAEALEVAPGEFVRRLISYYDPKTYEIVFKVHPRPVRRRRTSA